MGIILNQNANLIKSAETGNDKDTGRKYILITYKDGEQQVLCRKSTKFKDDTAYEFETDAQLLKFHKSLKFFSCDQTYAEVLASQLMMNGLSERHSTSIANAIYDNSLFDDRLSPEENNRGISHRAISFRVYFMDAYLSENSNHKTLKSIFDDSSVMPNLSDKILEAVYSEPNMYDTNNAINPTHKDTMKKIIAALDATVLK